MSHNVLPLGAAARTDLGAWPGKVVAAWGDGNPNQIFQGLQNVVTTVAGPTPTGIGITVGRLVSFELGVGIAVANVRYFGLAAVASTYTVAIYKESDGSRIWMVDPLNTTAGWSSAAGGFALSANTTYWMGISAKLVGTVAAFRSPAAPIANSLGVLTMPGSMATYDPRFAQVTLVAGAWPTTLPTKAAAAFASAGATGTVPMFVLDSV